MTNQTQVREQVEQILAGKILKQLAKLGAAEEGALKQSVAAVQVRHDGHGFAHVHTTTKTIPTKVVAEILTKLGKLGLVRKISVAAGYTFIARRDATREELLAAVKLSLGESRYSDYAATKPGRRQRYEDGETSFVMADATPLTDPEEIHYSEREDAMTYEGSVPDDPFEAELPADSETANVPTHGPREFVVTEEVRAKIAYQDRIGQGSRNARRTQARYLKTDPVVQQWFARKEMEESTRREERRAFRAAGPANTPRSPEQDHADSDHN